MGRDRTKHNHLESKFMTLCTEHHREAHTIGLDNFNSKYVLAPIKLDKRSLKELGIQGKYPKE